MHFKPTEFNCPLPKALYFFISHIEFSWAPSLIEIAIQPSLKSSAPSIASINFLYSFYLFILFILSIIFLLLSVCLLCISFRYSPQSLKKKSALFSPVHFKRNSALFFRLHFVHFLLLSECHICAIDYSQMQINQDHLCDQLIILIITHKSPSAFEMNGLCTGAVILQGQPSNHRA